MEQQFVQNRLLGIVHVPVGDEQRLALHDDGHLLQVIANQGGTGAYDIENTVGQPDTGRDFHRTGNDMDVSLHPVFLHEFFQDIGIGSGYLLAFEPRKAGIIHSLGDGQRKAALAEAQTAYHHGILLSFHKFVFAHDTQVGHSSRHGLRNIVVAQVKHLDGEIGGLHQQGALG